MSVGFAIVRSVSLLDGDFYRGARVMFSAEFSPSSNMIIDNTVEFVFKLPIVTQNDVSNMKLIYAETRPTSSASTQLFLQLRARCPGLPQWKQFLPPPPPPDKNIHSERFVKNRNNALTIVVVVILIVFLVRTLTCQMTRLATTKAVPRVS